MRYHLVTLGCAKNTVDSMRLERALRGARHAPVDAPGDADLVLVNTCGFIDAAKTESIEVVADLDRDRPPGQRLYVVGCMTQIAEEELRAAVPGVDATFGVEAWDAVAASIGPADPAYDIPKQAVLPTGPSAYLKISDGCDRPCTFCIIPSIKGGMRSEPAERLLAEARMYAAAGVRELVLVAQDSTAYGEDRRDRDGLADLLERLAAEVPEVAWLRLMYAYPGRVTRRLAETMAALPNVAPYIDIPLQHGSDAVLRRMKRPSLKTARRSLDAVREAMPEAAVRTTFIVGFPGETDAEFAELLDFVEEQRFDHVGAFTYSPQPGHALGGLSRRGAARGRRRALRRADGTRAGHLARAQPRARRQYGTRCPHRIRVAHAVGVGRPGRRRPQPPRRAGGGRPRVRARRVPARRLHPPPASTAPCPTTCSAPPSDSLLIPSPLAGEG